MHNSPTGRLDRESDLIALRRDLHRWPELAGDERRTASAVAGRLRAAGLSVSTGIGGHGVVAVLDGTALGGAALGGAALGGAVPGRTVAFRADMDAVATDELTPGEFSSRVPGVAHVCGHDLHTAIGVGIAEALSRLRRRISGRVVFVFQPAEETLEGARAMIDAGVLDDAAPEEIYALHCGPLPVGTFAVMPGVGQPGVDIGHIEVTGPDASRTAERLAAAITNLSTVAPPRTPAETVRFINYLKTPSRRLARFVLAGARLAPGPPGAVRVELWLRTWPDDRYPALRDQVRRLAELAGGARVEFALPPFPAMVCSAELSHAAAAYLRGVPEVRAVDVLRAPFPFKSDDFALFLRRVPGAMLCLGVADPDAGRNGIPHAPDFAADERAIGLGVRAMAGFLVSRLRALPR